MLVVDRRSQFFLMWAFPQGCFSVLLTWHLASHRVGKEVRVEAAMSFRPSLENHTRSPLPYFLGHTDGFWVNVGDDHTRVSMAGAENHLGSSWRLAITGIEQSENGQRMNWWEWGGGGNQRKNSTLHWPPYLKRYVHSWHSVPHNSALYFSPHRT